jgi:hypothetical protein
MPAVLDEAYISPFDKVLGGPGGSGPIPEASSGSADIKMSPSYGISGGPGQPYQQNYHIEEPQQYSQPQQQPQQQPPQQNNFGSVYNTLPTLTHVEPGPNVRSLMPTHEHKCDQLINQIMSCRTCRQKLRVILIDEHEQNKTKGEAEAEAEESEQKGGGFDFNFGFGNINQSLLINFVIGIAIMFLLDRIIKLKLAA